jgi:prepilin-type N-terminal cleavage/methylation domain-containing protein
MGDAKTDNRGLTLIEVIVTLLIASLVLLAVTGLLAVSTRAYHNSSIETSLQMEAQVALNQIDDLIIKANSYAWVNDIVIDGITYSVLGMEASEEIEALEETEESEETKKESIDYYYAVIHDTVHKQLRFRKEKKENVSESNFHQALMQITEEELSGTPSLLANYVSSLKVSPDTNTKESLVTVSILLELDGKTFSSFSSISMRNGV